MDLNTKDLNDLLFGSAAAIAADLGVSKKSVQRWQKGIAPPAPIVKLLQLRYGDLSGIFGLEWEGFYLGRDGLLYVPGWKYGWSAHELRGWFFAKQELHYLRRELKKLQQVRKPSSAEVIRLHVTDQAKA